MPSLGRLHLITDTRPGRDPLGVLRAALAAARSADAAADLVVQVRVEDDMSDRDAYELTGRAVAECAAYQVTCLVNDRLHVALATGAAGAHVGALDLPVDAARRVLGPDAVLGATARDPATGRAAVAAGATYLGVGPCYATGTKTGLPDPIGPAGLAAVVAAVDVPVVAIAGITVDRVPDLLAAGAHGVAVVGAIAAATDPGRATAELLAAVRQRPAAADGAPA
ncbi:thiamine phosphate synthase [Solwaraspora sp. WMMD792]|uniref:thiamine phosphate synthase n=1 Tax=Solwaraspora sp. WMMD792 TaxID=3016099 RepID=UPI0024159DE3|nr:thiamine phosphate synthase [Solwaraspora sp. WMMD792]MDG4774714.1 thiamine phosphate synthase [Solwaraspora sp. WMMD792]